MSEDLMTCARCGQPHDRCAAHNRAGGPCGLWPKRGQRVCGQHGGAKPAAIANGERRQAQAEAQRLVSRLLHDPDAAPVTDAVTELQRVAGRMGHAVDVLGERVNDLPALDYADATLTRRAHVVVEAWRDLTVEYRRTLTDMTRLGIEQRLVELEEAQVRAVAAALGAVLDRLAVDEAGREEAQRVFMDRLAEQVPREVEQG